MKKQNKQKGDIGEELATQYLIKKKYKILERNFRIPYGEIDIIAKDKKTIVFVEVKRRLNLDFGRPVEAVTPYKVNKIKIVAESYLEKMISKGILSEDVDIRFDIIEIIDDEITQIENAFQ